MAADGARKWWALIAIAASVLVVGLDLTVLNLALPTMATDLHASTSDLQWIADSYSLVLAAVMLPAGLLGDRLGRKKVLLVALVLFGAASAACAYAAGTGELIAARAVLGIGAAAIFPLSLSVIPVLFAPEERQKAIALMASSTFISFPIGPVVGGYLLDHFWWGSVFLINVPVVALALIAVAFLLPESRSAERPGVDVLGVILSSAGLAGLTYGFIKAGQDGWTDAAALGTIAAGIAVLALLVAWERWLTGRGQAGRARPRTANADDLRGGKVRPLIELRLFRSAGFTWGTTLSTLVSFAMFGIFFVMPQYFQEVRGADAMGSGLRLLPMIGGMVIGMIGGTRLASARKAADGTARAPLASAKLLVTVGFTIMAAALAVGAGTSASSGTGFAAAWFAVFGFGLGAAMPQAMNAALGALSAERSGAGSALISALRQVGATIGVAVLGTVLGSVYRGHLAVTGLPAAAADAAKSSVAAGVGVARQLGSAPLLGSVRHAFVTGMDTMLWVCAGIALVSAVLAVIFLPRRAEGITEPAVASAVPAVPGAPATADVAGGADGTRRTGPAAGRAGSMTEIQGASQDRPGGLRERKKARTRAALRQHALRLFRENGYQNTTVEQIAAAAEVSPSTFFRYFPTKEDLVLQDDMDTRMAEAFERQPAGLGPVAAFRAAIREVAGSFSQADLDVIRETTALIMTVPEVRARATDEFTRMITVMSEALARRTGRPADDVTVRALAGGFIGVILSVTLPMKGWPHDDHGIMGLFERTDQALALLKAGLPL